MKQMKGKVTRERRVKEKMKGFWLQKSSCEFYEG